MTLAAPSPSPFSFAAVQQIPAHDRRDIPHAPSPTSYVCVSSSDSDSDSPSYCSQPDAGRQEGSPTSRSRVSSDASVHFSRAALRGSLKGTSREGKTAASKPQRVEDLPVLKDAESFQSLSGKAVKADEVDGQGSAKYEELIVRVQELEQEVAALRAAAAAAAVDRTEVDRAGSNR